MWRLTFSLLKIDLERYTNNASLSLLAIWLSITGRRIQGCCVTADLAPRIIPAQRRGETSEDGVKGAFGPI
jgi:hypothetical protein